MDNFCTPINQLGNDVPPVNRQSPINTDSNKEPLQVQNYSEILKSINTPDQKPMNSINQMHEIQQQNMQQQNMQQQNMQQQNVQQQSLLNQQAEHQAQLQQQYAYHQQQQLHQPLPQAPVNHVKPILKKNIYCDNDFQNEALSLLCVHVLIHSEFFQNLMKSKFPSTVNTDTGKTNILGIIIQGIILLVGFSFTKKIILKYIKDA